jgi:hypothetical protein
MNWLTQIQLFAFQNELEKIAFSFSKKKKSKFQFSDYLDIDDLSDALEEDKEASLKEGKKYPSKEMKKEYDAANDSETEDLDAATNYSPRYPTDHLAIKQASDKTIAYYFIGKNTDGKLMFPNYTKQKPQITPSVGYRMPLGDISHGDGETRSYDYGVNS